MTNLDFIDFDQYLQHQNNRIIHQIWFGTIPTKKKARKIYNDLKSYRDSWKIKNPTWCHVEWSKKMCLDLINNIYPEHSEMFLRYKYEIQRCDAVRYLILYRYGGWYADMDYLCNRSVDEALQQFTHCIYFVQSRNNFFPSSDHISNSLMYSRKLHPFWKKLMIELEKNHETPYFYPRHLAVMFSTGPGILNRVYSKYKYSYRLRSLPSDLFHPIGIGENSLSLSEKEKIFTIHLGKGSWENIDSKFFIFLYRDWKIVLLVLIGFVFLCFLTSC
jgi:inositol phosphorylceramide mannosyltransferase catalytic subunit